MPVPADLKGLLCSGEEIDIGDDGHVTPWMVQEAISLHPVVAAAVSCLPDSHRGEVVKAHIQLRPGKEMSGGALRAVPPIKLAAFEIPPPHRVSRAPVHDHDRQAVTAPADRRGPEIAGDAGGAVRAWAGRLAR